MGPSEPASQPASQPPGHPSTYRIRPERAQLRSRRRDPRAAAGRRHRDIRARRANTRPPRAIACRRRRRGASRLRLQLSGDRLHGQPVAPQAPHVKAGGHGRAVGVALKRSSWYGRAGRGRLGVAACERFALPDALSRLLAGRLAAAVVVDLVCIRPIHTPTGILWPHLSSQVGSTIQGNGRSVTACQERAVMEESLKPVCA
eukprot:365826-Chlamydomonas_euryale.AAC.10